MSDASQVRLSWTDEDTYGVFPSDTLNDILFTSESLGQDTESVQSQAIRGDRQRGAVKRTKISAAGAVDFELAYGHLDLLLQYMLFSSAWSAAVSVGPITTIDAAAGDNSFNDSGSGFGSVADGDWIEVRGFSNAANNGYFKVVTATAAKLIVSGGTLVTEAVGPSVTIKHDGVITNGTTLKSVCFEKHFQDLGTVRSRILGAVPNSLRLRMAADSLVTGSMDFLCAKEESGTTSSGSGYTAAPTTDPFNCVDEVKTILEAQAAFSTTAFEFNMSNNLRERMVIGTLGAVEIKAGTIGIEGTLQSYFSSAAHMDKYLNFTATSIAAVLEDVLGNAYVLDLPRVRYTAGRRVAGGIDTDVVADVSWQAERDPTEDIMVRLVRFAA